VDLVTSWILPGVWRLGVVTRPVRRRGAARHDRRVGAARVRSAPERNRGDRRQGRSGLPTRAAHPLTRSRSPEQGESGIMIVRRRIRALSPSRSTPFSQAHACRDGNSRTEKTSSPGPITTGAVAPSIERRLLGAATLGWRNAESVGGAGGGGCGVVSGVAPVWGSRPLAREGRSALVMDPRPVTTAATTAERAAVPPRDRLELHNTAVDESVAAAGACAQLHVQTGRTCTLKHHHSGSCDFVARDRVGASLAARRASGGW
jgi:hypothetical protein